MPWKETTPMDERRRFIHTLIESSKPSRIFVRTFISVPRRGINGTTGFKSIFFRDYVGDASFWNKNTR